MTGILRWKPTAAFSLFVSQSKIVGYAGDGKSVIVFKDCEIVRHYIPSDPLARALERNKPASDR
jgi:hypothetical protein